MRKRREKEERGRGGGRGCFLPGPAMFPIM